MSEPLTVCPHCGHVAHRNGCRTCTWLLVRKVRRSV